MANKNLIKEASIVPKPTYKVSLEGQEYNVYFDTNISETKRGLKIRFIPTNTETDPRELNDIANKIAIILQKKFANTSIQIDRDLQPRNPLEIGFTVPLASISDFIMNKVIKGQ
jgi:hypothetical protein